MNNTITLQKSQIRAVIDFIGSLMEALDVDNPTEFKTAESAKNRGCPVLQCREDVTEGYEAFVEPLVKVAYNDSNTDSGSGDALDRLKRLLEKRYGNLDNECGCYVNGQWLSVADIVSLIDEADEEF